MNILIQKQMMFGVYEFMSKNNLIKGTIILTIAGVLTRIIGFFYRIYLSNAMGAELLGIYQLVFPVYGICFTIYASGLQTSISSLVAAEASKGRHKNVKTILTLGICISFSIALLLSLLVHFNARFIASELLKEARCYSSLRILAYVFPFCGVTACINGYYYGLKKTGIPATTQLLEQVIRVIGVFSIVTLFGKGDVKVTCELAVLGLVIGEIASNLYNVVSLFFGNQPKHTICKHIHCSPDVSSKRKMSYKLIKLTLPLTGNRLFLTLLHSFEAILIPAMLRRYGLSNGEALSVFGVLNGMVMPFIMFPTAITNALAILLLPTISEALALGNHKLIGKTTTLTIKYSLIIGVLGTGVFVLFGMPLGITIFHNKTCGEYLKLLSLLCPFLYVTSTLSSVINGLGKAHITFVNSIIGMTLRIALIVFLVPIHGIWGYLISLLISQLLITLLDGHVIAKETKFYLDVTNSFIKPGIIVGITGYLLLKIYEYFAAMPNIHTLLLLMSCCAILCFIFIGFMFLFKGMSRKDFSHN